MKAPNIENHSYSCEGKEIKKIIGDRASFGLLLHHPSIRIFFLKEMSLLLAEFCVL